MRLQSEESPNLPIAVAGGIINLLNSSCVATIIDTVRTAEAHFGCPVGLIIIDTFNKGIAVGGGDENTAKDQNITAANLQQVQDVLTDVHVALIGHTGKDESRGARGSNAHLADVDMMVQISVDGDIRTATITMINDGVEGVLTRFKLKPVTMGQDEDGDDITTAIVSDDRLDNEKEISRAKLNKSQRRAMELLDRCIVDEGEPAPTSEYPIGVTVVPLERWRSLARRAACHRQVPRKAPTRRSTAPREIWLPCIGSASGTGGFGSPTNEPRTPTDRTDTDKSGQSPTLSEVQFRTDTDTPL